MSVSDGISSYTDSEDFSVRNVLQSRIFNGKISPKNQPSLLLSAQENHCIFNLLGEGCKTLSTAVVQLLVSSYDQLEWVKKGTGVACFVRDQVQKSYFIEVFCLKTSTVIFSQELYRQFEFEVPHPNLVTFEAEDTMAGLNFADLIEASHFKRTLQQNLEKKRSRIEKRRAMLMKIHENMSLKDSGENQTRNKVTEVQTTDSKGRSINTETNKKDLGYAMFCKRMELIGLD